MIKIGGGGHHYYYEIQGGVPLPEIQIVTTVAPDMVLATHYSA